MSKANDKKPMTESDFIGKIEWEGGMVGALEYGLTADDVEPGALHDAWVELEKSWVPMRDAMDDVEAIIEEIVNEDH